MNVTDKSKLGVLVGAVMKETKGLGRWWRGESEL